jgi:hypothetical protein
MQIMGMPLNSHGSCTIHWPGILFIQFVQNISFHAGMLGIFRSVHSSRTVFWVQPSVEQKHTNEFGIKLERHWMSINEIFHDNISTVENVSE